MKKIFGTYTIFLILFTLFSYSFVDLNLIYLKPLITDLYQTQRQLITFFYFLFLVLFFVYYLLSLKTYLKHKISNSQMWNLIKLTSTILILAYPGMLSYDIFNYIATSKVLFLYHENPYIIMPIEFLGDPLLLFMHAANKVALYGPFWIMLTGIPFLLSLKNFLLSLLLFKLFVASFYFGTVVLINKMSKNFLPAFVFALNPLVIIETFISGHNDIVMMFFAMGSLYFLSKKRMFYAFIFLFMSILIKYATIFLLPIWIYIWIRQSKKDRPSLTNSLIFLFAAVSMFIIFLLSSFREEIYPWYAIWFLPFTSLLFGKNLISYFSISLSFGLMLRYIPFMLLGTYFGPTPFLKIILMLIPVILGIGIYYIQTKKSPIKPG